MLDIIVLMFCFFSVGVFYFLGGEKLFHFYIGLLIGFLLFLLVNQEMTYLSNFSEEQLFGMQKFLYKNSDFVLTMVTGMIPIFGLLSLLSFGKNMSIYGRIFLSFLLPFFLVAMGGYILKNIPYDFPISRKLLEIFQISNIGKLFLEHQNFLYYLIFFLIFYKLVFNLLKNLFLLLVAIGEKNKKKEESSEEEKKEEK